MNNLIKPRKLLLQFIDIIVIFVVNLILFLIAASQLESLKMSTMPIHWFLMIGIIYVTRILFGVYLNSWRYASISEYLILLITDLFGGVIYLTIEYNFFKGVLPITYITTIVLASAVAAILIRLCYQTIMFKKRRNIPLNSDKRISVAIIGAGSCGYVLLQSLRNNHESKYKPYCFIDKDPSKIGNYIDGVKIYAEDEDIIEKLCKMPIQEIIIAIGSVPTSVKKELFDKFSKTNLKIRIYDFPFEKSANIESKRVIRDIKIEDLLFRESISFADDSMCGFYTGKTILVTGGGGSIGSELCRQISRLSPKKLIILDIYENNAYDIQQELLRQYGKNLDTSVEIASVRDKEKIRYIFSKYRPEIVFHAAAHKHVPLMEDACDEAIKNNVFGTYNVANAAEEFGTDKFIMISTDKAVNPTNVMGASKRMCEMIIESKSDSKTNFAAVRFGNVLGSNGSIIPLFKKQIENGGPITITDKRIIRYFMTIPEATQLVMQAGCRAKKSEIYVLDMGQPIQILKLAENMIQLCGLIPYEDIDIIEIGLRPGEKLYEELLMKTENLDKTENEKIFIERGKNITRAELETKFAILKQAISSTRDNKILRETMKQVVPTFFDADEVNRNAAYAIEMINSTKNTTDVSDVSDVSKSSIA